MNKKNVYDLTYDKWVHWFEKMGYTEYSASQVWDYLYRKKVRGFAEMTDVKEECVTLLAQTFSFSHLNTVERQESTDGTVKFLFQLWDGQYIETVMMRFDYGVSVCVTTQVGCNMGCSFCASGLQKKVRDLTCGEIVGQMIRVQNDLDKIGKGESISNVVVMGIGEPFDNFTNVVDFLTILLHHKGLAVPGRSVTVSTCGIPDKIKAFAQINLPVNLAVSLHGSNNPLRNKIMRINEVYPIEVLMDAISYYIRVTNRRMTIEYILLKGVNDLEENAVQLAEMLSEFQRKVYVNLIPYNPVDEHSQYERSDESSILTFYDVLKKRGIQCKIRQEHGADIDGACGQLRTKRVRENRQVIK